MWFCLHRRPSENVGMEYYYFVENLLIQLKHIHCLFFASLGTKSSAAWGIFVFIHQQDIN